MTAGNSSCERCGDSQYDSSNSHSRVSVDIAAETGILHHGEAIFSSIPMTSLMAASAFHLPPPSRLATCVLGLLPSPCSEASHTFPPQHWTLSLCLSNMRLSEHTQFFPGQHRAFYKIKENGWWGILESITTLVANFPWIILSLSEARHLLHIINRIMHCRP